LASHSLFPSFSQVQKQHNIVQNDESVVDDLSLSELTGLVTDMTDMLMKLNIQIQSYPFANKDELFSDCAGNLLINNEVKDPCHFSYPRADLSKCK
jgi:hypothetical protein